MHLLKEQISLKKLFKYSRVSQMAYEQHRIKYCKQPINKQTNRFQNRYTRRKSSPLPDVSALRKDVASVRRQSIAHVYSANTNKFRTSLVPCSTARGQNVQNGKLATLCEKKRSNSMGNFKSFLQQKKSASFADILLEVAEV